MTPRVLALPAVVRVRAKAKEQVQAYYRKQLEQAMAVHSGKD